MLQGSLSKATQIALNTILLVEAQIRRIDAPALVLDLANQEFGFAVVVRVRVSAANKDVGANLVHLVVLTSFVVEIALRVENSIALPEQVNHPLGLCRPNHFPSQCRDCGESHKASHPAVPPAFPAPQQAHCERLA